jgi:hypothetical protein
MADGSVIPSIGQWVGKVSLGRATVVCTFEVFPSGESWDFLVGKPMQRLFGAVHNHVTDEVSIPNGVGHDTLVNEIHYKHVVDMLAYIGLGPTSDIKQCGSFGGLSMEPVYPSTTKSGMVLEHEMPSESIACLAETPPSAADQSQNLVGEPNMPWTDVWKVEVQSQASDLDPGTAQPEIDVDADTSIFT